MQNLLRHNADYRRVTRWGDQRSVQRAVAANFERLTGLSSRLLWVACPFWESQFTAIHNFGSGHDGWWEVTDGGCVLLPDGTISCSSGASAGIKLNLVSSPQPTEVSWGAIGLHVDMPSGTTGNVSLAKITGFPVTIDHQQFYYNATTLELCYASYRSGSYLANESLPYDLISNLGNNLGCYEFAGEVGLMVNSRSTRTVTSPIVANAGSMYSLDIGDFLSAGFKLGGLLVFDFRDFSGNVPDFMSLMMARGWELFQPTSFTSFFIGPSVDDVEIIYNPDAEESLRISATASIYSKLLMGLCFSEIIESESDITADQWVEILYNMSAFEAVGEMVLADVYMEVNQDGTFGAIADFPGTGFGEKFFLSEFDVIGEITATVGCGRDLIALAVVADGSILADQWVEVTHEAPVYETLAELTGQGQVSVLAEGILSSETSMEYEIVPGGSVFIDWIVGESHATLEGNFVQGALIDGTLEGDGDLLADFLAQYSLTITNGLLASFATILADVQVTNLPTTGDLRKTDLMKVIHYTDLISRRR